VPAATLPLPPGTVRRRYGAELVSELWGMTTWRPGAAVAREAYGMTGVHPN